MNETTASLQLVVNGKSLTLATDGDRSLLDVLRNDLDLKASHFGCGAGECGACMVMVDGVAMPACDTPLWSVAGKHIVTAEGLGSPEAPHPIQSAFIAEQAMQCGYCASGMMIAGAALLARCPQPSRDDICQGLQRNLCRCGAHLRIIRAVQRAAAA